MSSCKWNNLNSALKYWRPKQYSKERHVKFWPFTLKIFAQLLGKIKLFCKQRKIIKIKFRTIWSILKAFTASRNLDIYKNNVLLSPSGDLGIGLVWDNHPYHPHPPYTTFWYKCWNRLQTGVMSHGTSNLKPHYMPKFTLDALCTMHFVLCTMHFTLQTRLPLIGGLPPILTSLGIISS